VSVIWIGTLAYFNVKERKNEIGVLRALGYGAGKVAYLFLGRAVLLGILGAFLGFLLGTAFSLIYGPEVFTITASAIKPIYKLLLWSVLVAPLFAAIASFIPAMIAISTDPAIVLRDN
jgi:ABC-type antimicrobial peptide transport system permease subunit